MDYIDGLISLGEFHATAVDGKVSQALEQMKAQLHTPR
jgi:hypothetical protein